MQRIRKTVVNVGIVTGVVLDVDVGAALDKFLHLLDVAAYRRHVQRRLASLVPLVQLLVAAAGSRCPPAHRVRRQRPGRAPRRAVQRRRSRIYSTATTAAAPVTTTRIPSGIWSSLYGSFPSALNTWSKV